MASTTLHIVTTPEPETEPSVEAEPHVPAQRKPPRLDAWQLGVVGPVELRYDGAPVEVSGIARSLLALLARAPGEEVSTASIVASIWGSDVPEDAQNTVAAQVSKLRKALTVVAPDIDPTSVVITMPSGYILQVGPSNVDADDFERLLAEGRRALTVDQPALALS